MVTSAGRGEGLGWGISRSSEPADLWGGPVQKPCGFLGTKGTVVTLLQGPPFWGRSWVLWVPLDLEAMMPPIRQPSSTVGTPSSPGEWLRAGAHRAGRCDCYILPASVLVTLPVPAHPGLVGEFGASLES